MKFDHPMFVYILLRSYWIVIWPMWNADLTPHKGGIQKSIACVQAHFSSPHSSCRLRRSRYQIEWACLHAKVNVAEIYLSCELGCRAKSHAKISQYRSTVLIEHWGWTLGQNFQGLKIILLKLFSLNKTNSLLYSNLWPVSLATESVHIVALEINVPVTEHWRVGWFL